MAKLKLHRCSWTFLHTDRDACWKVQRALDEQGVEYEVVKHGYGRGGRDDVEALSGQRKLPVIELDSGEIYRAESDEMAARVRAGSLATGGSNDVIRSDEPVREAGSGG
jgi:glutaredoxin